MTPIIGNKYEIINSRAGNNGIIVTVIGTAPDNPTSLYPTDRWVIDTAIRTLWTDGSEGLPVEDIPACQLKPIDDDSRDVVSWESMKDIWQPELIEV